MGSFRIALVQPITSPPPDDEVNVAAAIGWIKSAAAQGADFVCFPENYPGPWRMPASFDPTPADRRGRREAQHPCRLQHDRADRCREGNRL